MYLINRIDEYGRKYKGKEAYIYRDSRLTYDELLEKSDALAAYINCNYKKSNAPVIVYGHKQKEMIICFIACMKSGHPYVPVDVSTPVKRVEQIIRKTETVLILDVSNELVTSGEFKNNTINNSTMQQIFIDYKPEDPFFDYKVQPDDVMYIIFTSGSTGEPKGSKIPFSAVESFVRWGHELCGLFQDSQVFLNQAPYSFDLSVMDLYVSLYTGSTLYSVDKKMQMNYPELMNALNHSGVSIWVSTPSFAEMCLRNKRFNGELLTSLKTFIFCGEVLTNRCAKELLEKFPGAKVINCYGPSECTFAITAIQIDEQICQNVNPLPVGYVKKDCKVLICDSNGQSKNEGETGEIIIAGESVGLGYINNSDATEKSFYIKQVDGHAVRHYKTGDKGYLKNGILYYCGRIDNQIKFNGYRIELDDIETNIRQCSYVENCSVIPITINEKIKYLIAVIVTNIESENIEDLIKHHLQKTLPEYMIPARIEIRDTLPMTSNGKVDRKLLQLEYNESK